MGPIGCPETMAANYESPMPIFPGGRRSACKNKYLTTHVSRSPSVIKVLAPSIPFTLSLAVYDRIHTVLSLKTTKLKKKYR